MPLLQVYVECQDTEKKSVRAHLLTGLSVSSSLRIDLPSISAGISIPAMSSRVGAKSMFKTMCGLLQGSNGEEEMLSRVHIMLAPSSYISP